MKKPTVAQKLHSRKITPPGFMYHLLGWVWKTFIAKKYIEGGKGFKRDFLIDRVCKTAEYDIAIKQGEIDEWTALLQYVFESLA